MGARREGRPASATGAATGSGGVGAAASVAPVGPGPAPVGPGSARVGSGPARVVAPLRGRLTSGGAAAASTAETGSRGSRGSQTRKVEPTPSRLSTLIRPPCMSTMDFTMASPRPLPLLRASFARDPR